MGEAIGVEDGSGSSPRLRGTRASLWPAPQRKRFIPAPAGNTQVVSSAILHVAVHPRACGEHGNYSAARLLAVGSSPRLRGTPPLALFVTRFIPAPAGNTTALHDDLARSAVHPRACGEHTSASPLPWRPSRFIPAPAGNTTRASGIGTNSVHPRACGEHDSGAAPAGCRNGSSPRLRGTRRRGKRNPPWRRFIPAPAGNTKECGKEPGPHPVHPRACGEHIEKEIKCANPRGSSPRLRGTLQCQISAAVSSGSSPRLRGTRTLGSPASAKYGSSPRLRGTRPTISPFPTKPGSSPRLRGTRSRPNHDARRRRFIPAPAGNTDIADRRYPVVGRFIPAPAGNTDSKRVKTVKTGSSPRLRGTRLRF